MGGQNEASFGRGEREVDLWSRDFPRAGFPHNRSLKPPPIPTISVLLHLSWGKKKIHGRASVVWAQEPARPRLVCLETQVSPGRGRGLARYHSTVTAWPTPCPSPRGGLTKGFQGWSCILRSVASHDEACNYSVRSSTMDAFKTWTAC